MKVSIDGLRRNMAGAFNMTVRKYNRGEDIEEDLNELASFIGGFLCVYDDSIEGDFSDLSEVVELEEVRPRRLVRALGK